ncbi:MAG: hypothetical protein JNK72_25055 [Myxococcales bacterium]|nr:hypothetical protein [Myxococcales bacterium]
MNASTIPAPPPRTLSRHDYEEARFSEMREHFADLKLTGKTSTSWLLANAMGHMEVIFSPIGHIVLHGEWAPVVVSVHGRKGTPEEMLKALSSHGIDYFAQKVARGEGERPTTRSEEVARHALDGWRKDFLATYLDIDPDEFEGELTLPKGASAMAENAWDVLDRVAGYIDESLFEAAVVTIRDDLSDDVLYIESEDYCALGEVTDDRAIRAYVFLERLTALLNADGEVTEADSLAPTRSTRAGRPARQINVPGRVQDTAAEEAAVGLWRVERLTGYEGDDGWGITSNRVVDDSDPDTEEGAMGFAPAMTIRELREDDATELVKVHNEEVLRERDKVDALRAELDRLHEPRPEPTSLIDLEDFARRNNVRKALEVGVTKGPWRAGTFEAEGKVWVPSDEALAGPNGERCLLNMNLHFPHSRDRQFIAVARDALPEACADVDRLLGIVRRAVSP